MSPSHSAASPLGLLNDFLSSDRVPETALSIVALDGFLTGIAVGPQVISPNEWLPLIWGGQAPKFDGEAEGTVILSAIMLLYNDIVHRLALLPETFNPIKLKGARGENIAGQWAQGFVKAMRMHPNAWTALTEDEAGIALIPILYFGADESEIPPEFTNALDAELVDRMLSDIPASILAIATFWRMRRESTALDGDFGRRGDKIGRNDACPCGSGKKFKKCCGRPA